MRSVRLFIVGVLIQGSWLPSIGGTKNFIGFDLEKFRIMGILQRIAICYAVVLVCALYIKSHRAQWFVAFACVTAQTIIQRTICVPGCSSCSDFSLNCNSESYLDRLILGNNHLYKPVEGYDPEGLVASLGAIFTCLCGYLLAGSQFTRPQIRMSIGASFIVNGLFLFLLGIPFNKALWTISYNLVTVGILIFVWCSIQRLFQENTGKNILVHLGSNAIFFFIMSDCGGLLRVIRSSVWIERSGEKVTLVSWFLNSILRVDEFPYMIIVYALIQLGVFAWICRYFYNNGIFLKL